MPELVALLAVGVEAGLSVNELSERIGAPQQSTSRYVSVLTGRYPNFRRPPTAGPSSPRESSRMTHAVGRSTSPSEAVVNGILQAAILDAKDAFHVGR